MLYEAWHHKQWLKLGGSAAKGWHCSLKASMASGMMYTLETFMTGSCHNHVATKHASTWHRLSIVRIFNNKNCLHYYDNWQETRHNLKQDKSL